MSPIRVSQKTHYRWVVCAMLFCATLFNYMSRQTLSLTWKNFIAPEFAWTEKDYGYITASFALIYAVGMLFSGKFITAVGTKRGYAIAISLAALGTILHCFVSMVVCGIVTGAWTSSPEEAVEILHTTCTLTLPITTCSILAFIFFQAITAIGQSANFPAAIHITAMYFPKKDRAFATALFNTGASVGAMITPIIVPIAADQFGWERTFANVGLLGYIWLIVWLIFYQRPEKNRFVNATELNYIYQDEHEAQMPAPSKPIGIRECLHERYTWALIAAKFLTDGTWWFFLFWTPQYLMDMYSYSMQSQLGMSLLLVLYLVTLFAIAGGYLPTYLVNNRSMRPHNARIRAMLIFAAIQLIGFLAVPLGDISPWLLIFVIGILGAAHQSWSANLFSLIGDYFPRNSIATVTGIIGMAGGLSSFIILSNSGLLIDTADKSGNELHFLSYEGKQAGYMMIMCIFSVLYLLGWTLMRIIMPKNIEPNDDTTIKSKL